MELKSLNIEAVYACVPGNEADNVAECTKLVGADKAQSIVKSTGFATRRVLDSSLGVYDMMLAAARKAMEGVDPATVGGIVVVTFSAEQRFPSLAARLQHALALANDVAALDVQMACAGYPYGLMVAGQMSASSGKRVLLVDGDKQSAHVDRKDVNTLAVMSDAATATLVSASGGAPARFSFYTDGNGGDVLSCASGGTIVMDGFGVFKFVAGKVTAFLNDFVSHESGIQLFVPHQANMYMVRQLAKSLSLENCLLISGEKYANPGSCSVALTLAANEGCGKALLAGFGAGLSAAAACVDIPPSCRRGIVEI